MGKVKQQQDVAMSDTTPVENSHVTEQTIEDSRPDPSVPSSIEAVDSCHEIFGPGT